MHIPKTDHLKSISVPLASSKSESNRALIIDALTEGSSDLKNLSSARDTQTMQRLLQSSDYTLDVLDAGTVMRFLTAYLCLLPEEKVVTGTSRMCQRPIGLLVDALHDIGASIQYMDQEGYPPLKIGAINKQVSDSISIPGNVSSQYISALLMIAPLLEKGLEINLEGEIYSLPYINMTLSLMVNFGVSNDFNGQQISIKPQQYKQGSYTIESDWSGASYWYSLVSLSQDGSEVRLEGLRKTSHQGDSAIVEIMDSLGVTTTFDDHGVHLKQKEAKRSFDFDFRNCPDLAQTVIALAAAKGIELNLTGLESLKIKETDRIFAMAQEVKKIGAILHSSNEGLWTLRFMENFSTNESINFNTYDDHRMAMALAPLCLKYAIDIEDPEVVKKSYPEFWDHLKLAGISLDY